MVWLKINEVLAKFYENFRSLIKTYNRDNYCVFKFSNNCEIMCSGECYVLFKYKPNNQDAYYNLYYHYNDDSVIFYSYQSTSDNILVFENLTLLSTEEGYFQEMTRQDLTYFEISDVLFLLTMAKSIVKKTKEYRNLSSADEPKKIS